MPAIRSLRVSRRALPARAATTGLKYRIEGFFSKALTLLCDALPSARRIGVLANPGHPTYAEYRQELELAAATRKVTLLPTVEARGPADLGAAFNRLESDRPQALMVVPDVLFFVHRREVIDFAARSKLPTMHGFIEDVEAGGLLAFATEFRDLYARAPVFVDKILKGANPADLPIEQPTRYGLWLSLRTARSLGLTLPRPVLLRAERVIERPRAEPSSPASRSGPWHCTPPLARSRRARSIESASSAT